MSETPKKISILFGTQTGNSEEVAFLIGRYFREHGIQHLSILPADEVPVDQWVLRYGMISPSDHLIPLIIVSSNTGQGEPPETIKKTWDILRMTDSPELTGIKYAIFGIGDSSYPRYNIMAKLLHNRLQQLGAIPLVHRGLGDEQDANGYYENLLVWMNELLNSLGILPFYRNTQVIPKRFTISSEINPISSILKGRHISPPTFTASVQSNRRLTSESHFQRVHHLEIARPEFFSYAPGDGVKIYPTNHIQTVENFLSLQNNITSTDVIILQLNTSLENGFNEQHTDWPMNQPIELQAFLTHYVDLNCVAPRSFLWFLSFFCPMDALGCEEAERLRELGTGLEHYDDYLDYCYREKRSVLEVLSDFPRARPPFDLLISYLPPMRPRYFSLSSSPSMDTTSLALTVSCLNWKTKYGRIRQGLCSSWLCDTQPRDIITMCPYQGMLSLESLGFSVQIHQASSSEDLIGSERPSEDNIVISPLTVEKIKKMGLLLVGTGTGVAPLRSIVREWSTWDVKPLLYLFLGFRYREQDFLYREEWEALGNQYGHIMEKHVFMEPSNETKEKASLPSCIPWDSYQGSTISINIAFSREDKTGKKCYVQNLLLNSAPNIAGLLKNPKALFILCGSAKKFPNDVESTLDQILATQLFEGSMSQALIFRKNLKREGRYQMETWSI